MADVGETRIKRTKKGSWVFSFSERVAEVHGRLDQFLQRQDVHDETLIKMLLADLRTQRELLAEAEQQLRSQSQELVTSQRRLEVERRKYRDLFNLSPNATLVTDRHGVIQEANTAASALIGIEPRHLRGKTLSSIGHGDDARSLSAATSSLQDLDCVELEVNRAPHGDTHSRVQLRGVRMKDPLFFVWSLRGS